jgi:hypothetical protein
MIPGVNIDKEIDTLFPAISSKKGGEILHKEDIMSEKQIKCRMFKRKMGRVFQGYHSNDKVDSGSIHGKKIEISPFLINNDFFRLKKPGFLTALVHHDCYHIVIIDDSPAYTLRLKRLISRHTLNNVKITTFPSLESAENYLRMYKCHLVFIDNIFPANIRSTGRLFAQKLLTDKKCPTKLVLMSGENIETVNTHQKLSTTSKTSLTEASIRGFVEESGIECKKRKNIIERREHIT